jgi:hypothetical protein
VKAYPVFDHFCIDFMPSPTFIMPIYSMGTDTTTTKTNLGKQASTVPTVPRRPSPSGPSSKLQPPGRSQSPSKFNNNPSKSPSLTTRVSSSTTKQSPNPNSADVSMPNQQGNSATSTTKSHNTAARVQGFFDSMLAHGR